MRTFHRRWVKNERQRQSFCDCVSEFVVCTGEEKRTEIVMQHVVASERDEIEFMSK